MFFFFFSPVHPSSVTSQNVLTLVITPEENRKPAGPRCFDRQFIMHKANVMLIIIEKMVYKNWSLMKCQNQLSKSTQL